MGLDFITPTKLFYPSASPTRRRRWRMHWASAVSVVAAVLAGWLIHDLHVQQEQRRETRLRDLHAPQDLRPSRVLPAGAPSSPRMKSLEQAHASQQMLTARQ